VSNGKRSGNLADAESVNLPMVIWQVTASHIRRQASAALQELVGQMEQSKGYEATAKRYLQFWVAGENG